MNKRHRAGLFLLVAALSGFAGLHFSREYLVSAAADGAVKNLKQAALFDLSGKQQTVSQWSGKVLVVNFWATWCAPCREEVPALMKAQRKYAANGVQIVGIAFDNAAKVKQFAEELGIGYVLLIGATETLDVVKQLGNRAGVLPFTVVLDRTGTLVHAQAGAVTEASLGAVLLPLL